MKKTVFDMINDLHLEDIEKGTRNVAVSPHLISAKLIKQGGKISMGTEAHCVNDLLNDDVIPLLLIINKKEYEKIRE